MSEAKFCCPKCGSFMFGSYTNEDGTLTRICHGNEKWRCDFSFHQRDDDKYFNKDSKMSKAPEEVFGESNITCPYCGYVDADSWEVNGGDTFEDEEVDCKRCDKTFMCDRDITVTYNTRTKE